jgi:hypothetical protein
MGIRATKIAITHPITPARNEIRTGSCGVCFIDNSNFERMVNK